MKLSQNQRSTGPASFKNDGICDQFLIWAFSFQIFYIKENLVLFLYCTILVQIIQIRIKHTHTVYIKECYFIYKIPK